MSKIVALATKKDVRVGITIDQGKKTVQTVDIPVACGWNDWRKLMSKAVKHASTADPDNFTLKIEVQIDNNFVDASTEENFIRLRDKMRYLTQLRVLCSSANNNSNNKKAGGSGGASATGSGAAAASEPSADAENATGNVVSNGRSKTPLAGGRTVLGGLLASSQPVAAAQRQNRVASAVCSSARSALAAPSSRRQRQGSVTAPHYATAAAVRSVDDVVTAVSSARPSPCSLPQPPVGLEVKAEIAAASAAALPPRPPVIDTSSDAAPTGEIQTESVTSPPTLTLPPALQRRSSFSPTLLHARSCSCPSPTAFAPKISSSPHFSSSTGSAGSSCDCSRNRSISVDSLRASSAAGTPKYSTPSSDAAGCSASPCNTVSAVALAACISSSERSQSNGTDSRCRSGSIDMRAVRSRSTSQSLVQPIVISDSYRDGLLLCPSVSRENSFVASARSSLDNNAGTPHSSLSFNSSSGNFLGASNRSGSFIQRVSESSALDHDHDPNYAVDQQQVHRVDEGDEEADAEIQHVMMGQPLALQPHQESATAQDDCVSDMQVDLQRASLTRRNSGLVGQYSSRMRSGKGDLSVAMLSTERDDTDDDEFGEYKEEDDDYRSWNNSVADLDSDVDDDAEIEAASMHMHQPLESSSRSSSSASSNGRRRSSSGGVGLANSGSSCHRRGASSSNSWSQLLCTSYVAGASGSEEEGAGAQGVIDNPVFASPAPTSGRRTSGSGATTGEARHSGLFFPATPPVKAGEGFQFSEQAEQQEEVSATGTASVDVEVAAPAIETEESPANANDVATVDTEDPAACSSPSSTATVTVAVAATAVAQDSEDNSNRSAQEVCSNAEAAPAEATVDNNGSSGGVSKAGTAAGDDSSASSATAGAGFSLGKRSSAVGSLSGRVPRRGCTVPKVSTQSFAMTTFSDTIRRRERAATAAAAAAGLSAPAAAATTGTTTGRATRSSTAARSSNAKTKAPTNNRTCGNKSVLTPNELHQQFMKNIKVVDYNAIAAGGTRKAVCASEPLSPTRRRVVVPPVGKVGRSNLDLAVPHTKTEPPSGRGAASKRGRSGDALGERGQDGDVISGNDPVFPQPKSSKKQRSKAGVDGKGADDCSSSAGSGDRLSIETLRRQLEIMKKVSGMSPEDIEWAGVKDNDGAYKYASNKHMRAEDNYFRSMWEIERYATLKRIVNTSESCKLNSLLMSIAASQEVFSVTPYDPAEVAKIVKERKELEELLLSPNFAANKQPAKPPQQQASGKILSSAVNSTILSDALYRLLVDMINESKEAKDMPRKAKMIKEKYYTAECSSIVEKFSAAESLNSRSMADMEMWEKRKAATKEYAAVMAAEERAWMEAEDEANQAALRTMRTFLTPAITGTTYAEVSAPPLTAAEILDYASALRGLYTHELAQELKNNKLLHWIVKHVDDIANASFLIGDAKAFFENLDALDLVECRALVTVLQPLTKFNVDHDGRKWEWRNQLFAKCKSMIDQANGVEVKGGWDGKAGKRAMVKLPPLAAEKQRRSVYYYRTISQYRAKLKQYDDKVARLAMKESKLQAAETARDEAAAEWNTLLKELRDDGCQETVGKLSKEDINALKKEALLAKTSSERAYKALQAEVANIRKTIEDAPVSREKFIEFKEQLEQHLLDTRDGLVYEDAVEPILIEGVFDADCQINKAVVTEAVAKFLSGADEQKRRQLEMEAAMTRKASSTSNENSSNEASVAVSPTPENADGEAGGVSSAIVTPVNDSAADAATRQCVNPTLSPVTLTAGGPALSVGNTPTRRASVLTNLPEGMLNVLNSNFSKLTTGPASQMNPPGGAGGTLSRPLSPKRGVSSALTPSETTGGVAAAATSSVASSSKPLQSKLLNRKMRSLNDPSPTPGVTTVSPTPALTPPGPMGGGLSFLDQLKARSCARNEGSNTAAPTASNSPVPSMPPMSPRPAMGLFEAIRARKVKEPDDS